MFLPVDIVIPLVRIYHKEIITSETEFNVCICKDAQETIICNNETLVISYKSKRRIKWYIILHATGYYVAVENNVFNPFYNVDKHLPELSNLGAV